jgi:hypothetical protein
MVAGLDRYFQLARCMRDEDLRADRQPEFTQLDVEMSFVDEEDVQTALETAISRAWAEAEFRGSVPTPFPRLTWREAMDRYGSDKPDTRFGLEIHDLTEALRNTQFRVFAGAIGGGGVVRAICVKGGADMTRSEIEGELTDVVKSQGAKGLAYVWLREEGWTSNVAKLLSPEELAGIGSITGAEVGDAVLMVADRHRIAAESLGALRVHLGRKRALYGEDQLNWLWVTEFPMFEEDRLTGAISPAHHPFTMVHADDVDLLDTDPLKVRSRAYDIVLNGREIGSGSIRITDPAIQERVFRAIGIDHDEAQRKFGFLLEAFQYGAPPHGGFAAGVDRLVMEGLREENIRDVIAFPKNQQAQELMTGAPAAARAGPAAAAANAAEGVTPVANPKRGVVPGLVRYHPGRPWPVAALPRGWTNISDIGAPTSGACPRAPGGQSARGKRNTATCGTPPGFWAQPRTARSAQGQPFPTRRRIRTQGEHHRRGIAAVRPSPGLILALLLVLVTTQTVRLLLPHRGPYAWTLLLSAAGLVAGEIIAASGHLSSPTLGVVHPLADVLLIAVLQAAGAIVTGRTSATR